MRCAGWLQVALVVLVCVHTSFAAHSTSLGRLKDRVSEDPPAWAFGLPNAYGFTVNPSSAWANKDIPRIEDFRAVLSDLDGTLADTDRLHTEAYNDVLVPKVTDRNMTEEEYAKVSFADDARVFSLFAKHRKIQLSDEQVKQLVVEKQKLTVDRAANSRLLYPGAKDLLHHISSRVPLALVTMSDRATALAVLKPYTIDSLFTTVVATEDVSKGKPDPMAYQIALAKINEAMKQKDPNFKVISPSEVLVLEDTARGVESGKSFGATVIAFEQTTPKKKLLARGADMTIPTVKALDDTLFRPASPSPSSSSSSSPSTSVTPSSSSSSSTAVTPSPLVSPALASPASSTLSSGSPSSSGCSKPPTTTIQPLTAAQDNWVVAHSRKRPQAC